jgi:hypothetical protein
MGKLNILQSARIFTGFQTRWLHVLPTTIFQGFAITPLRQTLHDPSQNIVPAYQERLTCLCVTDLDLQNYSWMCQMAAVNRTSSVAGWLKQSLASWQLASTTPCEVGRIYGQDLIL